MKVPFHYNRTFPTKIGAEGIKRHFEAETELFLQRQFNRSTKTKSVVCSAYVCWAEIDFWDAQRNLVIDKLKSQRTKLFTMNLFIRVSNTSFAHFNNTRTTTYFKSQPIILQLSYSKISKVCDKLKMPFHQL